MKAKYRNIFFVIGIAAIVVMLVTFDASLSELVEDLRRAGWWFAAILMLWFFLYAMHTTTWYLLLRNNGLLPMPFWRLYKVTLTGFALNSATPCGLMGSEPYKIMELTPVVGVNRATSSVILFAMMHIFSHFWFWLTAIVLYVFTKPLSTPITILLAITTLCCLVALYFFFLGYRKGLVVKALRLCTHIPGTKKWATNFMVKQHDNLVNIDKQIAELHAQSKLTFFLTLAMEYAARIISCLEIYFILLIFQSNATFIDSIIILAFTSLFANLLFIIPMQMGGREGGFAMSVNNLSIPARYGVFVGLICRLRELFFTILGMALMKVGNQASQAEAHKTTLHTNTSPSQKQQKA